MKIRILSFLLLSLFFSLSTTASEISTLGLKKPVQTDFVPGVYQFERIFWNDPKKYKLSILIAPDGMKLDSYGKLSWTAPEEFEGKVYPVSLEVKEIKEIKERNKTKKEIVNFTVRVASTKIG